MATYRATGPIPEEHGRDPRVPLSHLATLAVLFVAKFRASVLRRVSLGARMTVAAP